MRPIHGLFLVAAVALVLIGALVFWTGGDDPHAPASSDPAQRAAPEKVAQAPVDLTDAPDVKNDRSVTSVPASAVTRPDVAAQSGPARRVGGRVVDDAGRPIAGATVYAAAGGGFDDLALDEFEPRDNWLQRVDTKTDADGRFALEPRAQAQVRFAVRASGYAPLDVERTISQSKPDVGDLVVQTGVVLEGRVVDHLGRPVEGAELRRRRTSAGPLVMFAGRGGAIAAKTDAQGAFRIDCLGAGAWSLRVTSEVAPDKDESGETMRPGDRVRNLVFQLEEGFEISGLVRGIPAGEAAALRVSASPARTDAGEFSMASALGGRVASIAPNGSFVVRGCRKDAKYRVAVRLATDSIGAMMRSPSRSPTVDATAGERGLELVYRAETALTFQVVDDTTGAPVASMSVSAGKGFAMPLMDEKNRPVRNFPEGRVRYGGLRVSGGPMMRPGGSGSASTGITLRIESAGYAPYERDDVQVDEGADNDLGVIRLARTSILEVHVTSKATGEPVAGATVSLERVEEENGPGRVFSFRAASTIGGGDDDDEGIRFGGGGEAHRAKTGADGIARVSSLPGRTGRIVVRHKEFAELRGEPIDLPRDQDVVRSVVLSAGGTVVVKVVDAEGDAVANESIEHRRPGEDEGAMMFDPNGLSSDAEGLATLRREAAGVHRFRLARDSNGPRMIGGGGMRMAMSRRIEGGPPEPEAPWVEVTVTEGGSHEVVLVAPERARVVDRVREGGRPLSGATVRLRTKDGIDMPFFDDGAKAETDGQGEFALENVGVGEYVLSVSHASRVMAHEQDLRVGSGETRKDVELPLSIVEGRVTDEKGNGIAGLRVRAERESGGGGGDVRQVMISLDSGDGPVSFGSGGGGQVTTDAEGRYKLRGVLADTDLVIVASGQGVQRTASDAIRVPLDGTRSDVDLVVKKGATIEVTCRRPDGSPATPCEVRAELQGEGDTDAKFEITRGDGKARFQGLKPGRWRVIARDLGPPSDAGEPAPAEQMVDVEVGAPAQVTLEVRGT